MRNDRYSAFRILSSVAVLLAPTTMPAQTVPRADTPGRGAVRLSFEPLFELWDEQFLGDGPVRLGAPLSGDTLADVYLPSIRRFEEDVRRAGVVPGFVASLGNSLLSLRQERRTTPLRAEIGITDRVSLGFMIPVVRVHTRIHLAIDTTGASLGLNPLIAVPSLTTYDTFFTQFDAALTQLAQNITAGSYGCPASPQCADAMAFLTDAQEVRGALGRVVSSGDGAPFFPRAGSTGGAGITTNVSRIQGELAATWGVGGFAEPFLLPAAPADLGAVDAALTDTPYGFGVQPVRNTPTHLRFWLGDVEIEARYRAVRGASYQATVGGLVRLPTGHLDSPNDAWDLSTGDGQTDVEAQLVQELTLARRVWLNLSVRLGIQFPGERERRLAPPTAFLVSRAALSPVRWDPGDYLAADFAPLYRFNEHFAAGVTVGALFRGRDHSSFVTAADSIAVASRLGVGTPASVLDDGTAYRRVRLGFAMSYLGPAIEGGLSVEQTVSARGDPGVATPVPATTVFRVVVRVARKIL
jgi:hypothetical protein